MRLTREPYEPRRYGMTTGNEPPVNYTIEVDTRRYPDMYYAYKVFGNKFRLDKKNFILANGGENAIKNTLLALKPKSMFWTKPTWRMLEVYCEALNIKPINQEFIYNPIEKKFHEEPYKGKENIDIFYDCNGTSSTLKYFKNYNPIEYFKKFKWVIIDITYLDIEGIQYAIERMKEFNNVILVGSFDKLFGCGLRLGFAIFPDSISREMHLQREQYINPAAVNFLMDKNLVNPNLEYYEKLSKINIYDMVSLCKNYLVLRGDIDTTLPHTTFNISRYTFTKFGIPYTKEEYENLLKAIYHSERLK